LALPFLQVLLEFWDEPTAYHQQLPVVRTSKA
jgi:hypothetical protein